jgi:hypothetical protein
MQKVHIFTYAHKRPDFIELQYESIKKHVKNDFEYVIFNNAVDNDSQRAEISEICKRLGIRCVNIELSEDLMHHGGEINFNGRNYVNPNIACSYPLVWTFAKHLSDEEEVLCLLDSDMFFVSDIDLIKELGDNDLIYTPQWRKPIDNEWTIHYIATGLIILNLKQSPVLRNIDWHPGMVEGHNLDVGGRTTWLLKDNPQLKKRTVSEFSIREIFDHESGKRVHLILDYSMNYELIISGDKLIDLKRTGGHGFSEGFIFPNNKSFPHETEKEDYNQYLFKKTKRILDILENSNSDLPFPQHIAFIGFNDEEETPILHYKSGSNYLDFSTDTYNQKKTEGAKRILKYLN